MRADSGHLGTRLVGTNSRASVKRATVCSEGHPRGNGDGPLTNLPIATDDERRLTTACQ